MSRFNGDSSNEPVPGGSLTKPVLIALGALLVGRMFSGKSDEKEQPQVSGPDESTAGGGLGGLLGGLFGGQDGSGPAGSEQTDPQANSQTGGLGDLLGGLLGGGQASSGSAGSGQADSQAGGLGGLGGILGGLLGGALGGTTAGQAAPTNSGGGLGGLLEQLTQAGHADKVDSWVSGGQNAPIEPDQLGNAIGKNTISDIARQTGVNEQDLLAELSKALPGIVDKLTANGQVPDMQQLLKILGQK